MPPKNRRQNATPRDKRHENGLAAPGKQIKKSKPSPQPSGNATVSPGPTVASSGPFVPPPLGTTSQPTDEDPDEKPAVPDLGVASSSGSSEFELDNQRSDDPMANPDLHRQHPSSTTQNVSSSTEQSVAVTGHDGAQHCRDTISSNLNVNTNTVLQLHTFRDIFAILFLLLQLPPMFLVSLQCCFALLTLGGPTNGFWSFPSLASAPDFFSASQGGNPSYLTMVVFDVLAWICAWMLPTAWKDLTLDSAQAVVALSLGGGATGLGANLHCLFCMILILFNHLYHNQDFRLRVLDYLWILSSQFPNWRLDRFSTSIFVSEVPYSRRTWPRTLLELHIITQGIIRVVRRWVSRSDQAKSASMKGLSTDLPPSTSTFPTSSTALDPTGEGGRNSSTDGRPPGPPPATREQKERSASTAKKRRKQATIVRSQQPFWAALASTKVSVAKEMEQSETSRDAFEADSHGPYQLGDAASKCLEDRFWVSGMSDTEIFFTAIIIPSKKPIREDDTTTSDGQHNSKIEFRVLLNGTNWTSINYNVEEETIGESTRYIGKVFGLVPATTYAVDFIQVQKSKLMLSTNIVTRPATILDKNNLGPLTQPPKSLRPSSPKSTLKSLIAVQESLLQDKRNSLRKSRKDHRSSLAILKKEVDGNADKLNNLGPTEEKARQRQEQLRREIQQLEIQIRETVAEGEAVSQIPDEEHQDHARAQASWQTALDHRNAARDMLTNAKFEEEREVTAARNDLAQLQQKRLKAQTRLDTLNSKHENLVSSHTLHSEQQAREMSDRTASLAEFRVSETNLIRQITSIENGRAAIEADTVAREKECMNLEAALQGGGFSRGMTPQTPESTLAGLPQGAPPGLSQIPNQFAVSTPPPQSRRESVVHKNRGRSSSMLSTISNFTDNEIEQSGNHGHNSNGFIPTDGQADWSVHNGFGHIGQRSNFTISGFPSAPQRSSSGDEALQMHQGDPHHHQTSPPPKLNPIGSEVGRGSPKNNPNLGMRP